MQFYRNRRPRPAAAAPAPRAPAHLRSSAKIDLLDRMAPRDRDSSVANMQALMASHVGLTANSASAKANSKAIRDLQRKLANLRLIPPAEDADGNPLLDSDGEEIAGEDPDATRRALHTAQLVPLNTEATRIGKEKKKAATALSELLGVKVIASLESFNSTDMLRITATNDYDGLIALVVNYWDVIYPLANSWSITRPQ